MAGPVGCTGGNHAGKDLVRCRDLTHRRPRVDPGLSCIGRAQCPITLVRIYARKSTLAHTSQGVMKPIYYVAKTLSWTCTIPYHTILYHTIPYHVQFLQPPPPHPHTCFYHCPFGTNAVYSHTTIYWYVFSTPFFFFSTLVIFSPYFSFGLE